MSCPERILNERCASQPLPPRIAAASQDLMVTVWPWIVTGSMHGRLVGAVVLLQSASSEASPAATSAPPSDRSSRPAMRSRRGRSPFCSLVDFGKLIVRIFAAVRREVHGDGVGVLGVAGAVDRR